MKEKKKMSLAMQIFIALVLAIIAGLLMQNYTDFAESYIKPFGTIFLNLIKFIVVPIVLFSIMCGIISMSDIKKVGSIGLKTVVFYLCTTAFAVTIGLIGGNLFRGLFPVVATTDLSYEAAEATSFMDTLVNIFPSNFISPMAEANMLQVIVMALILGFAIILVGEKNVRVVNAFNDLNEIFMKCMEMILKLSPIGVFCLISRTFANIGFSAFIPLAKYMIGVLLALAIQCFGVYQILLKIFTGLNPIKFIKKFFPVMAFAFSTATSNATIPMSIDTLSKKVGVSKKISSFTIPLGATINMDGTSIMQGVAVVFAAQAFGIHLSPMDYVTVIGTATLASVGTAGVPSVGLVTLTMVFNSVGLPVEAIGLIMGIDRILDMTRTAVNITGDAVCTTIVAHQNNALDRKVFNESN